MAVASSASLDIFIPAYCLLAVGGQMTMMTCFSSSFLIPSIQNAVLAATSCLFDASSAVFLVFLALHQSFGVSRYHLFLGYAVFAAILYVALFVLWGMNMVYLEKKVVKTSGDSATNAGNARFHFSSRSPSFRFSLPLALSSCSCVCALHPLPLDAFATPKKLQKRKVFCLLQRLSRVKRKRRAQWSMCR